MLEGRQIDIAPLATINFALLANEEPAEIMKLVRACETHGFFYLNLQNKAGAQILRDKQSVLRITEDYFHQPYDVKMRDDRASGVHGYLLSPNTNVVSQV